VQQLQFFLSEADWNAEAVASRQIVHLREEPLTEPHVQGALVVDETGASTHGKATPHLKEWPLQTPLNSRLYGSRRGDLNPRPAVYESPGWYSITIH
jgi:hypothetical protein